MGNKHPLAGTLRLTQEEIDKGIEQNSGRCPVARAVAKTFPDATFIQVDLQSIRFTDGLSKERRIYLTPAKVQEFIVHFDAGDKVQPIRARLPKPAQIVAYQTRNTPHNGSRTVPRRPKHRKARLRKDGVLVGGQPLAGSGNSTTRVYGSRLLRVNKERAVVAAEPVGNAKRRPS